MEQDAPKRCGYPECPNMEPCREHTGRMAFWDRLHQTAEGVTPGNGVTSEDAADGGASLNAKNARKAAARKAKEDKAK